MIAKILNLLEQLSENELKELFEIIQRRYAVESKIAREKRTKAIHEYQWYRINRFGCVVVSDGFYTKAEVSCWSDGIAHKKFKETKRLRK